MSVQLDVAWLKKMNQPHILSKAGPERRLGKTLGGTTCMINKGHSVENTEAQKPLLDAKLSLI